MNRRRFLQALGLAPIAAKTYVFFGGIFRPKTITILEAWAEVDKGLESMPSMRAMQAEFVNRLFYGTKTVNEFRGMRARYR